jgi:hypothetical protein
MINFSEIKNKLKIFLLPCEENDFRARIFAGNFLVFFLAAIAVLKLGYALFICSFSGNPFYADITKTALVDLANAERAKQNLPALTQNPTLDQAAYLKAQDMAQKGYFNHISPSGTNPWHWFSQAGYNYKYAGENLAIGFLDSGEVSNAWMNSPTHKANIVNSKYKEIGIAVLKTSFQGNPATIVVQLFGTKPAVQKTAAAKGAAITLNSQTNEISTAQTPAVLGAAIEIPDKNSLPFKAAWFFSQEFFGILQFIIYFSLAAVISLLAVNFYLKADLKHADLLVKAAGFIALMVIFSLLDKELVIALLPHNLNLNVNG